ncbi:MAG: response regulator transcription factor [Thermodesulfovibrionia bacterium]|nr:response regulator transcription factor [Thermodesulfovibrionia bacterium]
MKEKILVVEDEKDIQELIAYYLKKEGFDVTASSDGEDALSLIRQNKYDLVILDLMLPKIHGMELCRILKAEEKTSSLPIIMLTAKSDDFDKVLGLESGADDYITKPFNPKEFIARVKAVLRRAGGAPLKERLIIAGGLEIDTETYHVSKKGKEIILSATEFRLLRYLMQRKGKVLSRDMLLDGAWEDTAFVEPRTVDVHIRRLREQIEDEPSAPRYIKTKRGIGYYFETDL